MPDTLTIRPDGALDLLSLGALVHRLDPGIVPFRKATECQIHVSGGEFNVAANLSDCFRMKTGIATAMVDYPIGDLVAERVRAMGVQPFYKHFAHDGVNGPNIATVYSDRGHGVRAPVVFYNRANEAAARLKPGDFDWKAIFAGGVRWFHSGGIFAALSADDAGGDHRGHAGRQGRRRGGLVRPELPREALEHLRRPEARAGHDPPHHGSRRCPGRQRGGPAKGARHPRPGGGRQVEARPERLLRHDRPRREAAPAGQGRGDDAARSAFDEPAQLERGGLDRRARPTWRRRASWTCTTASAAATASRPGFFYGLLTGESPEEAVKLGWAHGALLTTFPGDTTMATLEQVKAFAKGGSARIQR